MIGVIYLIAIFFSGIFFAYIKTKLQQKIDELDHAAFTPSDFCIMGQNMDFEGYSPQEIKEGVKQNFDENYNGIGEQIVYVNPAYYIGDFYKVSTRYTELTKLKIILEAYKKNKELTDE